MLWLALMCVLVSLPACNSSTNTGSGSAGSSSDGSSGKIDVMCLGDRINSPSENFHYSYRYTDTSGSVNDEADVTPQKIDLTITNQSGTHAFHGIRSDETSWNSAVLDLSHLNVTRMSATLNSLNGSSSIRGQGNETVNGYQATKYAIDTTSANASDKRKFDILFGQGSFEKGTAWMGQDGCIVKLSLDEGLAQSGGKFNKAHYEIARTKM